MANDNPYLELVQDNDAQGGASNPYTPLIQADTAKAAKGTMSTVIDINPDSEAKLQQLSKQYNIPIDALRLDPKPVERKAAIEAIDYPDLARKAPGTANFISDPNNAAVSHDDIENMSMIESVWKSIKDFGTTVSNATARGWQAQQRKWTTNAFNVNARTVQDIDRIEQMIADGVDPNTNAFNLENDPLGLAQMTREDRAKLRAQALELAKSGAQEISIRTNNMAAIPRPAVTEKVMNADKVIDPVATFYSGETVYGESLKGWDAFNATLAEFVKSPATFIADVGVESLIGNLDSLVLAAPASAFGGPALGAATMGVGSYNTAYASAFLENLESQGVDIRNPAELSKAVENPEMMDQARKTAHVYATVLGSFDAASMGVASKVALPKSLQVALKDKAFTKELVNMLVVQPQIQGTLGAVGEYAASSAVGKDLSTGELFGEYFGEMLTTPIEVISASGRRIYGDFVKIDAAQESARQLQKLNDLAAASKVKARDVETFEAFVASATEGSPIQDVYIDAQTLAQSGLVEQLVEVSPSVAAQFESALAAGTQVSIPVAEYTARIAGTELNRVLIDHLRTEPDGFSKVEADRYMQSFAEELKADVERTLAAKKGDDEFKAQVESVKVKIKTELDAAGRFTPEVNDAYAAMVGNFYGVMAGKLGITAEELFAQRSLNTRAQSIAGPQYDQNEGPFGPILTEFKGNVQGAIAKLKEMKGGEAIGALHHPDIGDIDLVWGEEGKNEHDGYGLSKLVRWHPEVLEDLQGVISSMEVVQRSENRAMLESADHKGGVRLQWDGVRKHWLLTAFRKDEGRSGGVPRTDTNTEAQVDDSLPTHPSDNIVDQKLNQFYQSARNKKSPAAQWVDSTVRSDGIDPTSIRSAEDVVSLANAVQEINARRTDELNQGENANRGSFNPATNTITLLKNADLSTFLHESGHFFLEMQFGIAASIAQDAAMFGNTTNKPGEQQILEDTNVILKWFGLRDLDEWNSLDFEEKRSYHEKFARGFEAYLFEGKSPSIEMQGFFQRFRSWLVNVYKEIKNLNVELTDEVRQVFDRMLATDEQIDLAKQGRSMMDLFTSASQAGMSVEEFAAYQSLGVDATNDAIQDLQARGLRDLAWSRNARGREIKKLQKQAAARRAEVTIDVRREVMSQPIYRAWQFLTGKMTADDKITPQALPKSDPNVVDETIDSLFTAIAKLGGLDRAEVEKQWGFDPKERSPMPAFGKYTLRREGGLSIDAMAEMLAERGYLALDENGRFDQRELEDKFDAELRGDVQYSTAVDERILRGEGKAGEDLNLDALGAGRFDLTELRSMGLPDNVIEIITSLKMTAKNGLHPDLVAERFGFSSGDELVRTLAIAQEPKQEINDLVDARMLELYGELATSEAIEREADKAIHNENRARVVATEANALAKAVGQRKVLVPAAKEFARAMIAKLKIRDIRPGQYAAAEVRAAKAAEKASKAGDLATAAAEKRNQLVNTFATRAAYDAQDEIESGARYLKKFENDGTRKNLDADYLDQIDALLDRFDLRKMTNKAMDKRTALATWLKAQEDQGLVPEIPEDLQNEAFRKPYKEMTVEEFRGLVDTVKQIEHLGRLKNRLLTAANNRAFAAVRDEIAQSIEDNAGDRQADTRTPTTTMGRALGAIKNFYASHIKAATWARVMDGGNDGGPVWEYLVRPANERGEMETTMRAEATTRLSEIMAPVFKLGKMGGKGVFFPSINRSLNRQERMAIALNTGNAGNIQRLLGGEGWTMAQIHPVLESLTSTEWASVQQIWDHFESYRPEIAAKERRVYGKEPAWVDPTPFQIKTADGELVDLRGGYYPIKYDPAASQRAEEYADAEGAKRQLQGAFTSATTRRSFTKTRSEEIVGRPLLYNLSGLYSGVNDVIHDLAWHEWLIDANRLLRSSKIDTAMRERYGPQAKAQFKTWVSDIAEGETGMNNAGELALSRLRQGVSAAGLGFNVMSAAMQVLGFTQSIVRVGPTWVGRGIAKFVANPLATVREVNAMSDFMANRSRTQFRELNELRNRVQDETALGRAAKTGAFYLMMRAQQMVDVPTWYGAYEKALAAGNSDERSIQLADQAVIDAQGNGQVKDLSAIERGGPALKLFTVFYSFMNTAFNLGVAQTMTANTPARKAKLAADYLLLYTVPAVLGSLMKEALTPGGGEEDWDKLAKKLAAEQLSYLMGMMVVVREFGEGAKIVAGAEGVRGYQGPAGVRLISDTIKFTQQAKQGEFDDAFRKSAINLIGDFTGLPAAQVNRTITGVKALSEGETQNPASVLFGFDRN